MTMPEADMRVIFGLNERQAAFVAAYLGPAKYNATRAALMAGYSPKHPRQSGHQVFKSPKVHRATRLLFRHHLATGL